MCQECDLLFEFDDLNFHFLCLIMSDVWLMLCMIRAIAVKEAYIVMN